MLSRILFVLAVAELYTAENDSFVFPHLRIISGKQAVPNSAPYVVYIEIDLNDRDVPDLVEGCGGSLLTAQHVLTAAHCVKSPKTIGHILVGAHNIYKQESTQQKVFAEKFIIHKDHNNPELANDIAIIKLKSPVTLNDYVKLVKLPTGNDASKTYVGEKATAYGWGLIHDDPDPQHPATLMTVDVAVISNEDCLKKTPDNDVYNGDICTDGTGVKGTCSGDSGGPLVNKGVQIGVISRGTTEHCDKGDPSVYTRVTSYLKWIRYTIHALSKSKII